MGETPDAIAYDEENHEVYAFNGRVILMLSVDVVPPASRTYTAIHMCKRRIQRYALEHNALPSALSETKEIEGCDNSIKDAWGRPLIYRADTNGLVTLESLGKNNKPGGTGNDADMVGVYSSRQPNGRKK